MHITIYCDGSSIGNPGPGGWGAVISDGKNVKEFGGFDMRTTNNRMELMAAIESLKKLKKESNAKIHTDSSYVINGITKWVYGWEQKGWLTLEKKEVLNKDLWLELVKIAGKHNVEWEHVRGHAGVALNERVDQIANGFARKERIRLFSGTDRAYKEFLKDMPKARMVSSPPSRKGKAYSYVSFVDGKAMTHKTWAECERRVKGKKAKFKKVFSSEEEKELIASWN
jgi:ribonuclease HI